MEEIEFEDIFKVAECGNGALEEGEKCDDGNLQNDDGCSYRCRIEPQEIIPPIVSIEDELEKVESSESNNK